MVYSCFVIATVRLLLSSSFFPPSPMPAARPGPASQEGYPSSSPSLDAHSNDPFNSANRRYYDNESDHVEYTRRDYRETYASDTSNTPGNDYDNNGNYEYREFRPLLASTSLVSFLAHLHRSPSRHRLRSRCVPTSSTVIRVARAPSRRSHGLSRLIDSNLHGLRRTGRRTGSLSCLECRAPNPALQGGDRRHLSRFDAKVWFPEGLDAEHGSFLCLLAPHVQFPCLPSNSVPGTFNCDVSWGLCNSKTIIILTMCSVF